MEDPVAYLIDSLPFPCPFPILFHFFLFVSGGGRGGDEPSRHQERAVPGVHKAGGLAAEPSAEAGESCGRVTTPAAAACYRCG